MLRRKNYWLLFAILLLSLTSLSPSMELNTNDGPHLVSKPQSQSTNPSAGEEGVVDRLRITVSLSSEEFRELELISSRYTLSTGVKVELSNVDRESADKTLMQDLTIGDSPDVVMTDGRNILDLATQGYLLPVDVYQSVPGSAPLTMLIPQMQWNGYNWGVPLDIDPYVLVYSPKHLGELGLSALPRSLDEWKVLLQNLLKSSGKHLLTMDTRNAYGFSAVLESMGSSLLSGDLETLEWLQHARGYFYLTSRYNRDIWDMLKDGSTAIAALPLSEWRKYGDSSLVAEAPLLASKDTGLEALYSRSFALPAQSRNPEEAVNWLAFVTSKSAQLEWLKNTGGLPALDELYRSGLPVGYKLPFATDILLTDETAPQQEPQGGWSKISEAVSLVLTGKLDAAGYKALLEQSSK
ncbi:extracellular solute-binding protein [Paenibacillus sp. 19GGS1-52]|uniref:extracellular solute-binding protein n=1 Tax=Paenibacillus sp. 19GGS1-52 TaxID=2758563 RepID=UPI001EFB4908|nr:extracellular solute-binding protein [Paenibacillus sp. 19GGS1-52]ULO08858.1 extracellular solute-binding protein [Paenibacillus sp. 19GGS1-52]